MCIVEYCNLFVVIKLFGTALIRMTWYLMILFNGYCRPKNPLKNETLIILFDVYPISI